MNADNSEIIPFLVIGNKVDKSSERKVSTQEAKKWCDENSIPYFETSAYTNKGVSEAFFALA